MNRVMSGYFLELTVPPWLPLEDVGGRCLPVVQRFSIPPWGRLGVNRPTANVQLLATPVGLMDGRPSEFE